MASSSVSPIDPAGGCLQIKKVYYDTVKRSDHI